MKSNFYENLVKEFSIKKYSSDRKKNLWYSRLNLTDIIILIFCNMYVYYIYLLIMLFFVIDHRYYWVSLIVCPIANWHWTQYTGHSVHRYIEIKYSYFIKYTLTWTWTITIRVVDPDLGVFVGFRYGFQKLDASGSVKNIKF